MSNVKSLAVAFVLVSLSASGCGGRYTGTDTDTDTETAVDATSEVVDEANREPSATSGAVVRLDVADVLIPKVVWCSKHEVTDGLQSQISQMKRRLEGQLSATLAALKRDAGDPGSDLWVATQELMNYARSDSQAVIASERAAIINAGIADCREQIDLHRSVNGGRFPVHPDQAPGLDMWRQRVTDAIPDSLSPAAWTVVALAVDVAASGQGFGQLQQVTDGIAQTGEASTGDTATAGRFVLEVLTDARTRFPANLQ